MKKMNLHYGKLENALKTIISLYEDSFAVSDLLSRHGFTVVRPANANEAKQVLADLGDEAQLVIIHSIRAQDTPVAEFAPEFKKSFPDLPIVVITGSPQHAVNKNLTIPGVDYIHSKFDSWKDLYAKLMELMGGTNA